MKSNIENLSDFEKKLNIQVSAQEVNEEFNKVFKYLQKNVENKGFRKGRTPMGIVRRLYADKVKEDVIRGLVENFYPKAIKEQKVLPVALPRLDYRNFDLEENKDFSFTANFEVYPEIEKVQIDSLEVEKDPVAPDYDLLVKEEVKKFLDNHSETEEVVLIRELREGDFAEIDFDLYKEGQIIKDQSTKDFLLEIGSKLFVPGFEEGLIGMKKGETKFLEIKFPDNYHEKSFQGELIKFKVTLNNIKKKIRPELNDEFVKKVTKFETVEELKSNFKQNIINLREQESKQKLKQQIFGALLEANPFEVPKTLLEKQYSLLVDNFKKEMMKSGKSQDEISSLVEEQKDRISKNALFLVRRDVLIRKIVDEYELNPTEKDLDSHLVDLSKESFIKLETLKKHFFDSPENKSHLKSMVEEEKVFQFLLGKAKVTVVETEKA